MHKTKGKLSGVLHKGFKPDKCKTSLRMAVARIKLLRNRKEVQVRQMRREVAQLLEANQDMTARIRVEHVIREEKFMQAYDLIEVYCELIVARLSIIDSQKACPIDLKEAIASVVFASMRCSDVTELADVRKHFTSKYGKEFAAAALEVRPDSGVNRLVIEKLSAGAPDVQTKIKTLTSIAEEHNIKWEPKAFEEKLQKPNEDRLYGSSTYSGGNISTVGSSTSSMSTPQPTYSGVPAATVNSATSHVPAGPYSHVDVSSNRSSNAFSQENIRNGSSASVPPSSQHGASAYYSAQIPRPDSISHGKTEAPPYSQYNTAVPDSVSRNEEMSQHRERKPSVSGASWNMEFKDATSAAQAAAESAEMASIAARAAAELASRGNYSGDQSTGSYEAAAYSHENTPRRQPAEHLVQDEKRSFHDHSSGINDPRGMPYARKSSGRAETNRVESQNISTVNAPAQQFHSYSPESPVYERPTEPPRAHSPEDEKRSFHDHSSGINDPRGMPYARKSSGRAETNRVESQNISTVNAPAQQFHSYSPESPVYERPTEPPRAHSPEPPHFDDFYERDSNIGTSDVHPFDFPEEKLQETGSGGRNIKDVEIRKPSFDQEGTNDYYSNFSSSQDAFTYGSSTVWDKQNGKTQDSSSVVFDQSDSDVEEENLLDTFSSKHTEQPPGVQDHMVTADWSQQHRSESSNHRTSILFSRTETQKSDNLGANRRDTPSPRTYDNLPPTFDSDGGSSDEEITATHTKSLKSASSGMNKEANRISGRLDPDVKEIEDYESSSSKKYVASSGLNLSYKGKHSGGTGGSPRSDYLETQAQKHLNHVQSRDSDLSDQETEADKLESASSPGANENQSLPSAIRASANSDDKEGGLGLNFGRLTPGLRNKPRQPPPYTKHSRENILPRQSLPKASATTEESVDSEENTTPFEQNRSSPKSSLSTRTSSGGNHNSELYDKNPIFGTRGEARSTMARNVFDSDDNEKLYEQSVTPSPLTTKSSEHMNSNQELYNEKRRGEARSTMATNFFDSDDSEKLYEQSVNPSPPTSKSSERVNSNLERYNENPGTGARQEMRSRMTRNYFDSDDSEGELEQQQTTQPKRSGVQIQLRRTRDVTSDTKRDSHVRNGSRYADETESLSKETRAPSSSEQRRVAPVYPRVAVQRSSPKDEHVASPMAARGKSQEAEMSRTSVPGNAGDTENSAGTPRESTPQTPPAHVHPKLPTDYDSFAAHFMSLRTNRR